MRASKEDEKEYQRLYYIRRKDEIKAQREKFKLENAELIEQRKKKIKETRDSKAEYWKNPQKYRERSLRYYYEKKAKMKKEE